MAQTITRGIKKLLAEANNEIETMNVADAKAAVARGEAVIVDIRDPRELEREGKIPGSFSCTRGMLEFWIDRPVPTPSRSSRKTRSSSSTARPAGARRSPPRRRRTWG